MYVLAGNFPADFVNGRETHPRFGFIDLKFLIWRLGLLSWFILNLVMLAESYRRSRSGVLDNTLLAAVVMQNLYIAYALFNEVRICFY